MTGLDLPTLAEQKILQCMTNIDRNFGKFLQVMIWLKTGVISHALKTLTSFGPVDYDRVKPVLVRLATKHMQADNNGKKAMMLRIMSASNFEELALLSGDRAQLVDNKEDKKIVDDIRGGLCEQLRQRTDEMYNSERVKMIIAQFTLELSMRPYGWQQYTACLIAQSVLDG